MDNIARDAVIGKMEVATSCRGGGLRSSRADAPKTTSLADRRYSDVHLCIHRKLSQRGILPVRQVARVSLGALVRKSPMFADGNRREQRSPAS
jgi:hypothetical protein